MGILTRLFGRWGKAGNSAAEKVSLTRQPGRHNPLEQGVSSGSYGYQPLGGLEEIRVLNLQRRADGTLACSIRHADINEASFTALSYAWGDVDSSFLLPVVDEDDSEKLLGAIPLTNNLNDALRDLAASSEVGETHFWIDQVCINQGDVNERNHQVALMKEIYGRARRVVTYVGPEESGDPEALDLLFRIHEHFKPYHNTTEISSHTAGQTVPPHLQFECDGEDPAWKQLYKIATGEWSRRLWMVQENLLNKDTVMLRGRRILPWIALPAITSLRNSGLLPHEGEPFGHGAYLQLCRHWLFPEPGSVVTASTTILVWHALQLFSSHLCSDPRDKVFGLLAITSDAEKLGIAADYNKTLSEVLIDVAYRILVNSGTLRVFNEAFFDEAVPDVPSWVPKWTGQTVMTTITHGRATRGADIMWDGTPNQAALRLYGFAVDKVARNLGRLPISNWIWRRRGREEVLGLFYVLLQIITRAKTELLGADNTDALICSTLLSDPNWPVPADSAEHAALAGRALRRYLGYMRDSFGDELDDPVWKRFVSTYESALERKQFEADCDGDGGVARARDAEYIATMVKSNNRAVFATADGKICLATRCAQPGDVVAALYGGQSLYVLRPKGKQFQYVGDAYIHGRMDGEVLDDPSYTRRVFELV